MGSTTARPTRRISSCSWGSACCSSRARSARCGHGASCTARLGQSTSLSEPAIARACLHGGRAHRAARHRLRALGEGAAPRCGSAEGDGVLERGVRAVRPLAARSAGELGRAALGASLGVLPIATPPSDVARRSRNRQFRDLSGERPLHVRLAPPPDPDQARPRRTRSRPWTCYAGPRECLDLAGPRALSPARVRASSVIPILTPLAGLQESPS